MSEYSKEQVLRLAQVEKATREYLRVLTKSDLPFNELALEVAMTAGETLRECGYRAYIPHMKKDAAGEYRAFDYLGEDEPAKADVIIRTAKAVLGEICNTRGWKYVYKLTDGGPPATEAYERYGMLVEKAEEELFNKLLGAFDPTLRAVMREPFCERVLRGFLRANVIYDDAAGDPGKKADAVRAIVDETLFMELGRDLICELDPDETLGKDIDDPEAFIDDVRRTERNRLYDIAAHDVNRIVPGLLEGNATAIITYIDENVTFDDTALRKELNVPKKV